MCFNKNSTAFPNNYMRKESARIQTLSERKGKALISPCLECATLSAFAIDHGEDSNAHSVYTVPWGSHAIDSRLLAFLHKSGPNSPICRAGRTCRHGLPNLKPCQEMRTRTDASSECVKFRMSQNKTVMTSVPIPSAS